MLMVRRQDLYPDLYPQHVKNARCRTMCSSAGILNGERVTTDVTAMQQQRTYETHTQYAMPK